MGGTFSKANRPKLEGAYFNWETVVSTPLPVSPGTIVAMPFKHDWGPAGQVVLTRSLAEWKALYGPSENTDGYLAAFQAFKGEGVAGRGGAGGILNFRFAGESSKAAEISIKNAEKAALKLVARYPGVYGNNITTELLAGEGENARLVIKVNGAVAEDFSYAKTDVKALADLINKRSDWVTATSIETGKALDDKTDGALTGGNDGTTKAADWTKAMEAFDTESFAVFAAFGQTEEAVLTSLKAWTDESNTQGHRFFSVVGAAAGELVKATELAEDMSSPEILVVDGVELEDEVAGAHGAAITLNGSQLCARVAGIFAARGEYQSLSAARLADTNIVKGRSLVDQLAAFDGGVITFARDSHATAPTHIKTSLSSWTEAAATEDSTRPYNIYRQPKYVRTMHGIEAELTLFAETEIIGLRPITNATRDALVAEAKRNLDGRQRLGVVQPGWTVGIDQDPPPTDEDEFIALAMSVKFGRALEQVFFTVAIS